MLAGLLFGACGSRMPMAAVTGDADELCVHDPADALVRQVVPHEVRVGVCFKRDAPLAPSECLVVDRVAGRVVDRTNEQSGDMPTPDDMERTPVPELVSVERSDHDATVCKAGACTTLALPGVADPQTVWVAPSADAKRISYVVRDAGHAYLDTIDIATHARLGRVPIEADHIDDHAFSADSIGTAVLVTDVVSTDLYSEVRTAALVQPLTGVKRILPSGGAIALDAHTALVFDARGAEILDTDTFATLDSLASPGGALADINQGIAMVALANPPALVNITAHRFGAGWRLPTCK